MAPEAEGREMSETTYRVRVDTPGGQRKTYHFDTIEEANAFVITTEDKYVSGPERVTWYTQEEAD